MRGKRRESVQAGCPFLLPEAIVDTDGDKTDAGSPTAALEWGVSR